MHNSSIRTKTRRRYHPPTVRDKLRERAQWKETLDAEANKAFQSFLTDISHNHYGLLRDTVNKLAVADCLISLALVATQGGYVRPIFSNDEDTLEIVNGRHPMVEALINEPFVPNSVCMGYGDSRSKIITGPNMGGKSSAVRMIALCAIVCFRLVFGGIGGAERHVDGPNRVVCPCGGGENVNARWYPDQDGW